MRPIKFRGKRKDNGEWAYGQLVITPNDYTYIYCYENRYQTRYGVTHETVGQFTGWYDRTRKEIYEGDVIELVNEARQVIIIICRFGGVTREVSGNELLINGFYFEMPDGRKCFPILNNYRGCSDVQLYKVIGNIHDNHDNPELNIATPEANRGELNIFHT